VVTGLPDEAAIADRLRERAPIYWPESAAPEVTVIHRRTDVRPHSRLHWYVIRMGGVDRAVVVKVVLPPRFRAADRMTLATASGMSSDFRREYEAMRLIDAHFRALADDRLGNVPILDRIEHNGGFVHEVVVGTPMTDLIRRQHRLRRGLDQRLRTVSGNTGAWLRQFHSVQAPVIVLDRPERDDYVDALDRYGTLLGRTFHQEARFAEIIRVGREAAERTMPSMLPVAVAHSDFVARNVLVVGEQRVVVLDTLARRHAPVYEDLAMFTAGLRLSRHQLSTLGLAYPATTIDEIERCLLSAYFGGDDAPVAAYRAYELLVLLDRWAGVLHWGRRGILRRPAQLVAHRLLNRAVQSTLHRLE
jgi:hypothetical protein